MRVLFANGARLSGELKSAGQDSITLQVPGIQDSLVLRLNELQSILNLRATTAPTTVIDTELAGAECSLSLPGVRLRGRLVDASAGDASCLVFRPRSANKASPLAAGASALSAPVTTLSAALVLSRDPLNCAVQSGKN